MFYATGRLLVALVTPCSLLLDQRTLGRGVTNVCYMGSWASNYGLTNAGNM